MNSLEKVEKAVGEVEDVNEWRDKDGDHHLIFALWKKDGQGGKGMPAEERIKAVDLCVKAGFNINLTEKFSSYPSYNVLAAAIRADSQGLEDGFSVVRHVVGLVSKELINTTILTTNKQKDGEVKTATYMPLTYCLALHKKHPHTTVKLLLDHGHVFSNVEGTISPVSYCSSNFLRCPEFVDCLKELLDRGADPIFGDRTVLTDLVSRPGTVTPVTRRAVMTIVQEALGKERLRELVNRTDKKDDPFLHVYLKFLDDDCDADVDFLRQVLEAGAEVDGLDSDGLSPLQVVLGGSTMPNWEETAKLFLEFGADINVNAENQCLLLSSILDEAPDGQYVDRVRFALNNGALVHPVLGEDDDPDPGIIQGLSYIMTPEVRKEVWKMVSEKYDMTKLPAEVEATDEDGDTPLMCFLSFAEGGTALDLDHLRFLLESGTNVNRIHGNNKTVLHTLLHLKKTISNWRDVACALLDAGADINKYAEGHYPVLYTLSSGTYENWEKECLARLRFALDHGADVMALGADKNNVLAALVKSKRPREQIDAVLEKCTEEQRAALVNAARINGCPLLHRALGSGEAPTTDAGMVEMLLKSGAAVDEEHEGLTPLQVLAERQKFGEEDAKAFVALLRAGADSFTPVAGKTDAPIAKVMSDLFEHDEGEFADALRVVTEKATAEQLRKARSEGVETLLVAPAALGDVELWNAMVEKMGPPGEFLSLQDDDGDTVLLTAVSSEDNVVDIVRTVLASGDAAVNARNSDGQTALTKVCSDAELDSSEDREEVARLVGMLLDAGADCAITDNDGQSPLPLLLEACGTNVAKDMLPVLKRMIQLGGTSLVSSSSDMGSVLLMKAAVLGSSELLDALVAAGADINRQDKDSGLTLLAMVAKDAGDEDDDEFDVRVELQTMESLTDAGADWTIPDKDNAYPLMRLLLSDLYPAGLSAFTPLVRRVLAKQGDKASELINKRHDELDGLTPVMVLASQVAQSRTGDALVDMLALFLSHGADLELECDDGSTAAQCLRRGNGPHLLQLAKQRCEMLSMANNISRLTDMVASLAIQVGSLSQAVSHLSSQK